MSPPVELPAGLVDALAFKPVTESTLTPGQREAVAVFRTRYQEVKVARVDLPLTVVCLFDPDSGEPELVPLE